MNDILTSGSFGFLSNTANGALLGLALLSFDLGPKTR
jgi:hypothetical protein